MENKEQEAREHAQMLSDMTVIRVKRRVPAKKEDKQPEEVKGGEDHSTLGTSIFCTLL